MSEIGSIGHENTSRNTPPSGRPTHGRQVSSLPTKITILVCRRAIQWVQVLSSAAIATNSTGLTTIVRVPVTLISLLKTSTTWTATAKITPACRTGTAALILRIWRRIRISLLGIPLLGGRTLYKLASGIGTSRIVIILTAVGSPFWCTSVDIEPHPPSLTI